MRCLPIIITIFSLAYSMSGYAQSPNQTVQPTTDFNLLLFGDSGTGEEGQMRVSDAMYDFCEQRRCDFAVTLGDNFYSDGVDSVDDKIGRAHV